MNKINLIKQDTNVRYHTSDLFYAIESRDVYILTQTSEGWNAISIKSGRSWNGFRDTHAEAVAELIYLGNCEIEIRGMK